MRKTAPERSFTFILRELTRQKKLNVKSDKTANFLVEMTENNDKALELDGNKQVLHEVCCHHGSKSGEWELGDNEDTDRVYRLELVERLLELRAVISIQPGAIQKTSSSDSSPPRLRWVSLYRSGLYRNNNP